MICSDCYLVYCDKDAQEQRRSPGKKAKTGKPKQAKAIKKGPLTVKPQPKVKAPMQAQNLLIQVKNSFF